jgi:hypothetical protein
MMQTAEAQVRKGIGAQGSRAIKTIWGRGHPATSELLEWKQGGSQYKQHHSGACLLELCSLSRADQEQASSRILDGPDPQGWTEDRPLPPVLWCRQ